MRVACIVEGDGEVPAVPVLLRRLASWISPEIQVAIQPPIRVYKDRFLNRDEEFRRHLLLAASKAGDGGFVLVLLDADDDCPAEQGELIRERVQQVIPHRRYSVVLANREFEAWFIAGAESLKGSRGFNCSDADLLIDPEGPRNAKKWVGERLAARAYHETTDQPALAAMVDLETVHRRSRSFRKLCSDWRGAVPDLAQGESQ
ncbi:DUF4276 family protein [Ramlibacter albus]|uniref:DUF4276 family protein n=1 Tax=Ramlibacter albus TaxID=2079448 RepID=A0A923S597_9BURK|nr:DUF4276 family protein [Ramlibacter albus]MBC5764947.1 DUF4276 family protein [Ramlibacter albus]